MLSCDIWPYMVNYLKVNNWKCFYWLINTVLPFSVKIMSFCFFVFNSESSGNWSVSVSGYLSESASPQNTLWIWGETSSQKVSFKLRWRWMESTYSAQVSFCFTICNIFPHTLSFLFLSNLYIDQYLNFPNCLGKGIFGQKM